MAKYQIIDGYRERHDLAWTDARLATMDLQYHDLRPAKSLFARLPDGPPGRARPTSMAAITEPPDDDPGVLPGPVPATLRVRDRRRQLGLDGVRPQPPQRDPPAGPDDGTAQRNGGDRR